VPNALDLPGFWAIINYSNWNVSVNDIQSFTPHVVNQFTFQWSVSVQQQLFSDWILTLA
jgi:hypothetical protein